MLDIHTKTKALSLLMQTNGATLADANCAVAKCVNGVRDLGTKDGPNFTRFKNQIDAADGTWLGLVLREVDAGKAEFGAFRLRITTKVADALEERFLEANPVYKAMRVVDARHWPLGAIEARIK